MAVTEIWSDVYDVAVHSLFYQYFHLITATSLFVEF